MRRGVGPQGPLTLLALPAFLFWKSRRTQLLFGAPFPRFWPIDVSPALPPGEFSHHSLIVWSHHLMGSAVRHWQSGDALDRSRMSCIHFRGPMPRSACGSKEPTEALSRPFWNGKCALSDPHRNVTLDGLSEFVFSRPRHTTATFGCPKLYSVWLRYHPSRLAVPFSHRQNVSTGERAQVRLVCNQMFACAVTLIAPIHE